jgi:hypothetical protein
MRVIAFTGLGSSDLRRWFDEPSRRPLTHFAGKRIRMVNAFVELIDRRPARVWRMTYHIVPFDRAGCPEAEQFLRQESGRYEGVDGVEDLPPRARLRQRKGGSRCRRAFCCSRRTMNAIEEFGAGAARGGVRTSEDLETVRGGPHLGVASSSRALPRDNALRKPSVPSRHRRFAGQRSRQARARPFLLEPSRKLPRRPP